MIDFTARATRVLGSSLVVPIHGLFLCTIFLVLRSTEGGSLALLSAENTVTR